jgi:hypothetical protein
MKFRVKMKFRYGISAHLEHWLYLVVIGCGTWREILLRKTVTYTV